MTDTHRGDLVVLPNDRVIRAALSIIVLVWWSYEGVKVANNARDGSALIVFVPFWAIGILAAALLLLWVAAGRLVYTVREETLRVAHRIIGIDVLTRLYHVASVRNLRVEERAAMIKGRKSVRYSILFDGLKGAEELAWYRKRVKAEAFVAQLRGLGVDCSS